MGVGHECMIITLSLLIEVVAGAIVWIEARLWQLTLVIPGFWLCRMAVCKWLHDTLFMLAAACCLLAIGCWLLAAVGCWLPLPVAGCVHMSLELVHRT